MYQTKVEFPPLNRRKIETEFSSGDITSNGSVLLLRDIDNRLGLLSAVDAVIPDPSDPRNIVHSLLGQRVYSLS